MILVAGGTGRLGGALLNLLAEEGREVRILARDRQRAGKLAGGIQFAAGDVREPHTLAPALAGVEAVVSAVTGFGPRGDGPGQVDHLGNANLIAAAEVAGVKRFVLVSVRDARPDHPLELNRMKFRAEERLRSSTLDWTILRPTAFMELWATIIGGGDSPAGRPTVFGPGDNRVNFVSVRDVARYVQLALNDPGLRGSTLEVGGPENLSPNEMLAIVREARDRTVAARHVPLPVLRLGALLMRPIRPRLADLLQAGVLMATTDMTFDPSALHARFPDVLPIRLAEALHARAQGPKDLPANGRQALSA
ncbi:MAG TPA: SDR family oxidoreductase [Candidatus Dormibacteraeota bacterium]